MKKELFKYPKGDKGVIDDFYREIYDENEYNKHGAKIKAGDIVVDCGAHIGMFSHFALKRGASKVYSFESMEDRYQCLVKNSSTQHIMLKLEHQLLLLNKFLEVHLHTTVPVEVI